MGNNQNEIIQAQGELLVVGLNLLGDTLSALGDTIEFLDTRDPDTSQKLEALGNWIVVVADIIELLLLFRENQGQLLGQGNQDNGCDIS